VLSVIVTSSEIRIGSSFALSLHRTLRLPSDDLIYPLPPSFGSFPIFPVEPYAARLPDGWHRPNAVFVPLWQREAMWLSFAAAPACPNAVTISVGRTNAVSGAADAPDLRRPQNYVVCPPQRWLDGVNTGGGTVRQFVATPVGRGATVDEQLAREGVSGIRVRAYEFKRPVARRLDDGAPATIPAAAATELGIAPGGTMRQKIYVDQLGPQAWAPDHYGEVFIHLLNSTAFQDVTGHAPSPTPIDVATYMRLGLPWYNFYDDELGTVDAPEALRDLTGIGEE
jgi:hypothetical protein